MMKRKPTLNHTLVVLVGLALVVRSNAALPPGYQGKTLRDSAYTAGAPVIPGRVEYAYFDLGGEGVAYHDTDTTNHGSGELNLKSEHHRPHAKPYSLYEGTLHGAGLDVSGLPGNFDYCQ